MPIISLNKKRDKVLNDFAREYRERTLSYLRNTFSLNREDCEDVFQDASIILYHAAVDGKLDNLSSSLYTYFIGICNNKAHEQLRKNDKMQFSSIDAFSSEDGEERYNIILNKADKILNMIESNEKADAERNSIVQELVKSLPSPCNELLWSFFRDVLSMKAIAQMFGYASDSVAKVTKHRCQEKFRKSYENILAKM